MGINVEKRVPNQVRAFLYNREKIINCLFAGGGWKIEAAMRPGKQKIFIRIQKTRDKIVIFYEGNVL